MLNHSDELFSGRNSRARPGAKPWRKEWAFQEGEKGFVPYFWDDGGSVSLDRPRDVRRSFGLISAQAAPDPAALADPEVDLRTLVPARED